MKKLISIVLAILMTMSVFYSTNLLAGAATTYSTTPTFGNDNIKTIFTVANNTYGNDSTNTTTNLSGISVGAANNRLFCVKTNSSETVGTLYYYNNIYDQRFATGAKAPKKIVFIDGLLGHGNGMAIDNNYIYVTMAAKNSGEKNSIIQISRRAISLLSDGAVVSKTNTTVKDANNNAVKIYTTYKPVTSSGATYTKSISAISKYSYDSDTDTTKFIVGYSKNSDGDLRFTFATLSNGVFTVSTSTSDVFYVKNPYANKNVVIQDINFDSAYGLYVAMWVWDANGNSTQNYVLRARMKDLKTSSDRIITPVQKISINKTLEGNQTITKFEIESMAFVKRDNSGSTLDDYKFIFSCNKRPGDSAETDSIEELVYSDLNTIPKSVDL